MKNIIHTMRLVDRWTPACGFREPHLNCPLGERARCLVDGTTKAERARPVPTKET